VDYVSSVSVDKDENIYAYGGTYSSFGIALNGFQDTCYNCNLGGSFIAKISCPKKYDTLRILYCSNDSFYFKGRYLKTSGTYYDTLDNWEGCDSFVTLYLTVHRRDTTIIRDTICSGQSRLFKGISRMTSGIYRDTLTNHKGCDSFVQLHLIVKRTDSTHIYDTTCANLPKIFNGQSLAITGVYRDTLTNGLGCDSHLFYHFVPRPIYQISSTSAICQGDSLLFGSAYRKLAGIYRDTMKTKTGCDSIQILTLTTFKPDTTYQSQAICPGQTVSFYSQVLATAGTYRHHLTNRRGCDSMIILSLSQKTTSNHTFSLSICPSQTITFNGTQINSAGIYLDTLTNSQGCDSFVTLTVTLRSAIYDTIRAKSCDGQTYRTYTQGGTYLETYKTAQGCDSLLTIILEYLPPSRDERLTHSKCGSYTYQSRTYTKTDSFIETIKNALNCDSIVRKQVFYLTPQDPMTSATTVIPFCEEISHRGIIRRSSFQVIDTFRIQNPPYCDSAYQPYYYQQFSRPSVQIILQSYDTVIKGEYVYLSAVGANQYIWSTGEKNQELSLKLEDDVTIVTLRGWATVGCEDSTSIEVYTIDQPILDVPTAFSPNGDGKNDYLIPNIKGQVQITSFDIYNRVGEKMYSYTLSSKGWDGTYKNTLAPLGIYSYYIEYEYLRRKFIKTGEFQLVR
jgi:gliding motility-associated-like protein